ncbi:MAG: polysaccharide biosynthesis protein, partial [Parafilimonas sp.]
MKEFRKFLLKNHITPKWIIFSLDSLICVICFLYANYLLTDFRVLSVYANDLFAGVVIVCIINAIFFYIFKTYEGIIRLSDFQEALRSVSAVFSTFFLILLINVLLKVLKIPTIIANSALIVYFFTCSFIISGYRMLVRKLYKASITRSTGANVIIYGVETNDFLVQKTIDKISGAGYRVVAFIDDDEKYVGKTIDNIRIYSCLNLKNLIQLLDAKFVFFARRNIDAAIKNKVVDECLAQHIHVMNLPPVENLIHDNLSIHQLQEVKIEELLSRPPIQLINLEVANFLSNKRILITGAAGSIGSELARQIAFFNPDKLIICDQVETGLAHLAGLPGHDAHPRPRGAPFG